MKMNDYSKQQDTTPALTRRPSTIVNTNTTKKIAGEQVGNGSSRTRNDAPPPLKFIDIDPNQRLPPPTPPMDGALMEHAETMVQWAISSKHENSPAAAAAIAAGNATAIDPTVTNHNANTNTTTLLCTNTNIQTASQHHQQLITLLNRKSSTPLLHATLHAIRTCNSGRALDKLVTHSKLHAQLLHLIMKLDPFVPPPTTTTTTSSSTTSNATTGNGGESGSGMDKLREVDRVRRERRKRKQEQVKAAAQEQSLISMTATTTTTTTPIKDNRSPLPSRNILKRPATLPTKLKRTSSSSSMSIVQISEDSIRHKEYTKYIHPTTLYFQYDIANAHLHLLITLISNNSIVCMSALRSIWGLLTEFGGRWMECWKRNHGMIMMEERRKKLRLLSRVKLIKREEEQQRVIKSEEDATVEVGENEIKTEKEEEQQPATKRQRLATAQDVSKAIITSPKSVISNEVKQQQQQQPLSSSIQNKEGGVLEQQEEEEEELMPELERPVPGMHGLSVEFVRDAFYNTNSDTNQKEEEGMVKKEEEITTEGQRREEYSFENDSVVEEIYSDRLASGRVHRLLLTLVNIFRLCPRSKSDLLREMTTNFPHYKTCPPTLYTWYTHMCLQMVHLVPTFEGPILSLFVDKALDMDVEIKINNRGVVLLDTSPREDEHGEPIVVSGDHHTTTDGGMLEGKPYSSPTMPLSKKRTFNQISNDSLVASSTAIDNHNKLTNNGTTQSNFVLAHEETNHVLEISERLDTLMAVLYQRIIKVTTFSPTSLSSAMSAVINARRLYRHLDGVFDKKVRTTDRSKFVQFVFFVLFGRENDALECVGRLMAEREADQQKKLLLLQQQEKGTEQTAELDETLLREEMERMDPNMASAMPASPINVTDPLYRGFSAKLIDFFFNPSYAGDVPRQTVVCYLASFVSRASYVCPETVCECIAALLRWAEVYISAQQQQPSNGGNNATPTVNRSMRRLSTTTSMGNTQNQCEVHTLFYTACQAAFYMMCFRGVEAISYYRKACQHKDDPESQYADPESVDIGPERWKFVCGHSLQPLKYCLESVRLEFLHLAEDLDLFLVVNNPKDGNAAGNNSREEAGNFLDNLWKTATSKKQDKQSPHGPNKMTQTKKRRRSTLISTAATQEKKRLVGGVGGLGRGSNPLNSFFPFDPYLLQKSYEHVDPYYRNWEDCILSLDDEVEIGEETGLVCDEEDEDASDLSDLEEDEEEIASEEEEDGSDEEDADDHSHGSKKATTKKAGLASLNEENHFEMEIRRSRAMSTGSQCSW